MGFVVILFADKATSFHTLISTLDAGMGQNLGSIVNINIDGVDVLDASHP